MGSYYQSCRWLRGEMKTAALVLISTLLSCTHGQNSVFSPPQGQRCRGRNYDGKRCCTPEQPCGLGEGDCDGPLDGGVNDGHRGCKGDLVCGSNNCKKFGAYFHEKDDCCDLPQNLPRPSAPVIVPGTPLTPPPGQRCRGRNFDGRRCCTPEQPCGEERETVTDLGTVESMTVTEAVELDWCAGPTTARSSEPTTTRRTIAARDQAGRKPPHSEVPPQAETGVPGRNGGVWLLGLSGGSRSAGKVRVLSEMGGWAVSTLRSDTPTLSVSETNQLLLSSIFISAQHCNKYI